MEVFVILFGFLFLAVVVAVFAPAVIVLRLGHGAIYFFIPQCMVLICFLLWIFENFRNLPAASSHLGLLDGQWPFVVNAFYSSIGIVGIVVVLFSMLFLALASRSLKRRNSKAVLSEKLESNN